MNNWLVQNKMYSVAMVTIQTIVYVCVCVCVCETCIANYTVGCSSSRAAHMQGLVGTQSSQACSYQ